MKILTTTSSFNDFKLPKGVELIKNPYKRRLTEEELTKLLEEYKPDGIVAGLEPLTEDVIKKAPFLKVISRCGVGMDNVDLKACEEYKVKVFNTPNAPVASVAEMTFAMIIGFLKNLHINDRKMRDGGWKGPKGNMLAEKTVGIIGLGRIGTYLAKLLKPFNCNVIGYKRSAKDHDYAKVVDFDYLIKNSDIITLHIPFNKETENIIGEEEIGKMKDNAVIINASRGGLIDEDALYKALKENKIKGAALDCYREEPYNGKLTQLDNVLLSPHMASSAVESRIKMEKEALDNLLKGI